jgi:hypothetical protein
MIKLWLLPRKFYSLGWPLRLTRATDSCGPLIYSNTIYDQTSFISWQIAPAIFPIPAAMFITIDPYVLEL